jgi:hypothetical protein
MQRLNLVIRDHISFHQMQVVINKKIINSIINLSLSYLQNIFTVTLKKLKLTFFLNWLTTEKYAPTIQKFKIIWKTDKYMHQLFRNLKLFGKLINRNTYYPYIVIIILIISFFLINFLFSWVASHHVS